MALPTSPCTLALVFVFVFRLIASMRVVPHDLLETRTSHIAKSMVAGTGASATAKPTVALRSGHSAGESEESAVSGPGARRRAPARATPPSSVSVQKPQVASLSRHSANRSGAVSLSERSVKVSATVNSNQTHAGHVVSHNHSVSDGLPECEQDSFGHVTGCRKSCKCGWTDQCYPKWVLTDASPSRVDEGVCSMSILAMSVSACGLFLAVLCSLVTARMWLHSSVDEELLKSGASPMNGSANISVLRETTSVKLDDGGETSCQT